MGTSIGKSWKLTIAKVVDAAIGKIVIVGDGQHAVAKDGVSQAARMGVVHPNPVGHVAFNQIVFRPHRMSDDVAGHGIERDTTNTAKTFVGHVIVGKHATRHPALRRQPVTHIVEDVILHQNVVVAIKQPEAITPTALIIPSMVNKVGFKGAM